MNEQKKITFNHLFIYLNIFFSFFLLLIYISIETDPEKYGYFSLLSLLYSPILLINIIFIFYWLIIKKPYFLLSTMIIIIGYSHLQKQIQFFGKKINTSKDSIKIISFNTRNFVHNGWEDIHRKEVKKELKKILNEENANIICLQEFPDTLIELDNEYYSYQNSGTMILTNQKIINTQNLKLKSNRLNSCIYIDLIHKEDTIRVYNMHLESVQIDGKDNFFKKIHKIKEANTVRINQIKTIKNDMENCEYPIIICGDMNNSPYSLAYEKITENLEDAFIKSGFGLGHTFKYLIPLRIDYIFHEKNIDSYNFEIKKKDISDHKMIKCDITVK